MDYEPEEQKRHISISAATNNIEWEKHRINIIDTPGDSNFAFDTKSCLRIVDGAVVLVDAVGGVEFQTEKVWEYADEFKLPRLLFISRMDGNGPISPKRWKASGPAWGKRSRSAPFPSAPKAHLPGWWI